MENKTDTSRDLNRPITPAQPVKEPIKQPLEHKEVDDKKVLGR